MEPKVLKPSQVVRLTKKGNLPDHIPGGHPICMKCRKAHNSDTESPMFWENGMYVYCAHCKKITLTGALYPPCADYPNGVLVDTRGERKKYKMVMR